MTFFVKGEMICERMCAPRICAFQTQNHNWKINIQVYHSFELGVPVEKKNTNTQMRLFKQILIFQYDASYI